MNMLNLNLRLWRSPVRSDARSPNSGFTYRYWATVLAGLILFAAAQRSGLSQVPPYNVLVNSGAETGDLTGWTVSDTGYINAISTNNLVDGAGSGYVQAHSGQYAFRLFDTTGAEGEGTASIYQDYAASSNSQWSASCYAICYASNYFSTAITYMSVAFYDTNNNVLYDTNVSSSLYGVYGSAVVDPLAFIGSLGWVITPTNASGWLPDESSGWLYLPATNFYYAYSLPVGVTAPPNPPPGSQVESGSEYPESTTLTAPPGTAFVRYQLEYDNAADAGGAIYYDDCALNKLNFTDPDITNPPVAVTVYAGLPASFTVGPITSYVGEKLKYQWQLNGTNLPAAGGVGDINGATTLQSLSFTNCQASDQGLYDVVVTDINTHTSPSTTNSIRSVPVALTVLIPPPPPPGPWSSLCDPGFETAPSWSCWNDFNGCYLVSTNDVYDSTTNHINVFDGNWCAMVGANGDRDNGFWQMVTAAPGTWWKAGGWAYISSLNDPFGGNTWRIQVWFKDASGYTVPGTPIYESFKIYGLGYTNVDAQYTNIDTSSPDFGQVCYHIQLPRDQWIYLPVTNVVNNNGPEPGDDLPIDTLRDGDFMVPTNTFPAVARINYQVYEYCPVAGDNPQPDLIGFASDAVYWDDMVLIQLSPVTNLTALVSNNVINLSFSAGIGRNYTVLYKTNLTDAAWSVLMITNVPLSRQTIDYYDSRPHPVTVADYIAGQRRFYRVQVQ